MRFKSSLEFLQNPSMIHPKRRNQSSIVDALGSKIVCGEYQPGAILPSIPELKEDFGVSQSVMREVLGVLSDIRIDRVTPKAWNGCLPSRCLELIRSGCAVLAHQIREHPHRNYKRLIRTKAGA